MSEFISKITDGRIIMVAAGATAVALVFSSNSEPTVPSPDSTYYGNVTLHDGLNLRDTPSKSSVEPDFPCGRVEGEVTLSDVSMEAFSDWANGTWVGVAANEIPNGLADDCGETVYFNLPANDELGAS